MAFCNKIGSLIRQTNGQASMLNTIRSMSSSKLFVGGLSFGTDDQSLKDAFSSFGDVYEARVISDRDTGRSRGFGFVSFSDTESASSAVSAMDGQELQGRNIRVAMQRNVLHVLIITAEMMVIAVGMVMVDQMMHSKHL